MEPQGDAVFQDTHWSLVIAAQGNDSAAGAALNQICEDYWFPLYAYIRRKGYSVEDAEDYTQGFFTQFLGNESIGRARKEKGKLRSFLLKGLQYYIRDQHVRQKAKKNGGGVQVLSLDTDWAESRLEASPPDVGTPSLAIFDREWGTRLLERTFAELEDEYAKRGRGHQYTVLSPMITPGSHAPRYEEIGSELKMTVNTVKGAVFRLRKRFRELLERRVTQTVSSREEVAEELRYLQKIFSAD